METNNCALPDDLYYSVEHNVWVRKRDDGTVEVGMTDIAQTMAGSIIHCRPKKVGKSLEKGKSLATVESGKWVGPVKSPFDGSVAEVNAAVEGEPTLLNKSPYKAGWIMRIKPSAAERDFVDLVQGEAAVEGYKKYMAEKGVQGCIHCEGYME